ncbi:hypothetical protein RCL_jg13761.t1 [Rhizophagus clarus]|uniref:Uncharacterized protein n=1 Tax=Rhizophagus clarus TaxID=94130 RepID=A0A8H3MGZ5_9GLOM|nr:hypothetical protein RCL_jg13761.t1 [Rhizophagus clarus]
MELLSTPDNKITIDNVMLPSAKEEFQEVQSVRREELVVKILKAQEFIEKCINIEETDYFYEGEVSPKRNLEKVNEVKRAGEINDNSKRVQGSPQKGRVKFYKWDKSEVQEKQEYQGVV